DVPAWWAAVSAPLPPGSARQAKRKLGRARRARWSRADEQTREAFDAYSQRWEGAAREGALADALRARQAHPEGWGSALRQLIEGAAPRRLDGASGRS
ncbi:unnamed protein product, partial [Prorocentrum cordatum]